MEKKTIYQLKNEAHRRNIEAFNDAMESELGWDGFHAHRRATESLAAYGFDWSDERVKAICAVAVRAVLDEEWANKLVDRPVSDRKYSLDLEMTVK